MTSMTRLLGAAVISSALLLSSGCNRKAVLRVDDAVVTLSPVDSNPSVLHFTVSGGEQDVRLLSAYSSSAVRTALHESKIDPKTKMMSMEKLRNITIPAGEDVEFKKGGPHGMVWGVNLVARRLGKMEFEFLFSNRDRILVDAVVQEADGSIPDERKNY